MYLSRENGWYATDNGEVYVKANAKYADNDPAVAALPSIFEKISDDAPPPKAKVQAAVAAAKSAVTGAGKASDG